MPSNLYKRGAIWWGRIQAGGSEHRRSLRTGDRAEAARRLEAWRKELTAAVHFGESRLTWKEAVRSYVTEVGPQAVKPGTLARYCVSLRQVHDHLQHLYVDQITRKVIADLVTARRKAGATNATINRDLTAVSAVLAAAVEWGAAETNSARDFNRRLTRERREPIVPPDDASVAAVIERAPGRFAELIRFLAETGCRQEEAAGLVWSQVDLKGGLVTFTKTKTSRPRTIRLEPGTVEMLKALPRYLGSDAVFWHGDGCRYSNVASRFREMVRSAQESAQRAGTPFREFRCHDLRHRYAIKQLQAGRDIYDLSKHLGHSSVKTTEIYLGYVPGRGGGSAHQSAREEAGRPTTAPLLAAGAWAALVRTPQPPKTG